MATLLFMLLAALALMAATASTLYAIAGSQRQQYSQHIATQAQMNAWTGVDVLSATIATLNTMPNLTAGGAVQFTGLQSGISAKYVGTQGGFLVFDITGSSAGSTVTLRAAYALPGAGSGGTGSLNLPSGIVLHGNTTESGSINYTGSTPVDISVYGGDLHLTGSVAGLDQVCATGAVTIDAKISVNTICSNSTVTLDGAASANTINAVGGVYIEGGTSTVATINTNGPVSVTGGSASVTTINASGNVTVNGGAASATTINSESNVSWSSSSTTNAINANGWVNQTGSGTVTNINAIGNVLVTNANNVSSDGSVTLSSTEWWGQGITGLLAAQGDLSKQGSWNGGEIVGSGTIGGTLQANAPSGVHVSTVKNYQVPVAKVTIPTVVNPINTPLTVDAYSLKSSANFIFTGVDSNGNPIVTVQDINNITNGTYFLAGYVAPGTFAAKQNFLCASVSGTTCTVTPVAKICEGFSDYNSCFSYSNNTWTLQGNVMIPSVLWFQGDLTISSGTWSNTLVATGSISTAGGLTLYAPNYDSATAECGGTTAPAQITGYGMSSSNYATQLCSSMGNSSSAAIGNIALFAGGYVNGTFSGGNISLGASNTVYGVVMAGAYLTTGGSTSVTGTLYSGAAGANTSSVRSNSLGGSTSIKVNAGGNTGATSVPCTANCSSATGNNIVWVSPI